jgi:uncharacterized membrane protein YfcA
MTREIGIMSLLSLPPALAGMFLGQKLRLFLPEARFRQVVQIFLWLIGAWLALRAFR